MQQHGEHAAGGEAEGCLVRGAGSDPRGAGAEEAVVEVKVGGGSQRRGRFGKGLGLRGVEVRRC